MAELIARVRALIADPAGAEQVFSDQDVQDALDEYRSEVRYAPLEPQYEYAEGGAVSVRVYDAGVGHWEQDARLYDSTYRDVTAEATADYTRGRWTFPETRWPTVMVVGCFYDPYGAAADLLDQWAAKLKLEFSFSSDGQSFQRGEKIAHLAAVARTYRAKQQPATAAMLRPDLRGD